MASDGLWRLNEPWGRKKEVDNVVLCPHGKKEQKNGHSIKIESKGQKTAEDGVSTTG